MRIASVFVAVLSVARAVRSIGSLSAIMDALNPLRNNASVAHPNDALLAEPEAMLTINATRTILHYLDAKLIKHRKDQTTREQKVQKVTVPFDDDIPF